MQGKLNQLRNTFAGEIADCLDYLINQNKLEFEYHYQLRTLIHRVYCIRIFQ